MFESLLGEYYLSSVINSVSKLPKEVVIAAAVTIGAVHIHKTHCDAKVKVAEAEARKAEAELLAEKIRVFAVTEENTPN